MSAIEATGRSRTAGVVFGLGIAVTGLAVMVWPEATVAVVGLLLGIGLLLYGIRELAMAPEAGAGGDRGTTLAVGIVSVLVGLAVLTVPLLTAVAIGTLLGIAWIVEGVVAVGAAFTRPGHRLVRGVVGVISLAAGIIVFAQPGLSLVAIAWFAGVWLLVVGLVVVGVALVGDRQA